MLDETTPLLTPTMIRELATGLGVRPTKQWGQNFVIDANTVRRIVAAGQVTGTDHVLEVGPGLGSLTLALLPAAQRVTAVEIDPRLAEALPRTVGTVNPEVATRLTVRHQDALTLGETDVDAPTALVANLPYNVAVPVVLHALETFPSLQRVLVMVQLEVAERLAATPGSKVYGVPSVKAAWYAQVSEAGRIGRNVFWPAPNVDSGLVRMVRRQPPAGSTEEERRAVFTAIDAAFAQRRKTLRAALAGWAGSPAAAEAALRAAGIDPQTRGERLTVEDFSRLASHRPGVSG